MKKFNKLVSVVVASAMVLAMAGCSKQDAGQSSAGENTQESNSVAANNEGTFKIGGIGPLTGGAAIYGTNVANAAQIAIDEINAAGGVNGYMLELNFQDDEHDTEKAVNAYNNLKDWGAQMILGTVTSGPCVAVTDKTREDNMFQLTPSGSATECTQYDNNFRVCFSDPNQGVESAKYIGENGLAEKVAIIYDSSDIYSSGIHDNFVKEAANQPFEIVSDKEFTTDSKTDFSAQIQAAKDANADMIFLPIYYQESALILNQAAAIDYKPAIFSCDGMDGILGVENFDVSLAEGVMFLTPFAATAEDELTKNFVAAYEAKHGETPNQFAADAYDGVYIIKAALEKSNVTPDMSVSEICEALKTGITSITYDGLTGTGITWDASGEPNKAPMVLKISGGVYTFM